MRSTLIAFILFLATVRFAHAGDSNDRLAWSPVAVDENDAERGSFEPSVAPALPCFVDCPPMGPPEGEPPCGDGYIDLYNSGCNGQGWLEIEQFGCYVCGKSGTYLCNGNEYRDTDWYDLVGTGDTLFVACIAEFPLALFLVYETNCAYPGYDIDTADACQGANLSRVIDYNQHAWVVVAPSVFAGVPCESNYTLTMRGWNHPPGTGGACCLPSGSCTYTYAVNCGDNLHGYWVGPCVPCDPDPCPISSVDGEASGASESRMSVLPNPTSGPITLDFTFPTSGWISAQILDVSGGAVRDLFAGTHPHVYAGEFSLTWDGRDDAGRRVASGVYVARVDGPGGRRTRRVVVAR